MTVLGAMWEKQEKMGERCQCVSQRKLIHYETRQVACMGDSKCGISKLGLGLATANIEEAINSVDNR